MKSLILFLFFINVSISQPIGVGVEVRLIEGAYPYDEGLTNILNMHGVTGFHSKAGHPDIGLSLRIFQTVGGDDLSSLLADLLDYTSVVQSAVIIDAGRFPDCCNAQLLDANVGVPVGFLDNIVLTNDEGLNAIFQTFHVYLDVQTYPSSWSPNLLRYYSLACQCDAEQLQTALAEYNAVIETTEPSGPIYLDVDEIEQTQLLIYPNPFRTMLEIESINEIRQYNLIDTSGKSVIETYTNPEFQDEIQRLKSGIYILYLQFDNGVFETRKIIKL